MSNWHALLDYLHADITHNPVERVRVLYLNSMNMLIATSRFRKGGSTSGGLSPRSHPAGA